MIKFNVDISCLQETAKGTGGRMRVTVISQLYF